VQDVVWFFGEHVADLGAELRNVFWVGGEVKENVG
jgi:hypothetical protein